MARSARLDSRNDASGSRGAGGKIMLITADRVVYVGLIGKPRQREFGSLTIYVSVGSPFRIQVGSGEWETAEMFVVAPGARHSIMSSDRLIGSMMIEPETVDLAQLPEWLRPTQQASQCLSVISTMRNCFLELSRGNVDPAFVMENFDHYFFGRPLERRQLDPRMASVVAKINSEACDPFGAEDCASHIYLSFSRFLHLFKDEVGITFRSFRAWKRARSFLHYVNTEVSLTDIALEIGYPDSSHFSHTVRRYWGLTPKDIVAGSRHLAVINSVGFQASHAC